MKKKLTSADKKAALVAAGLCMTMVLIGYSRIWQAPGTKLWLSLIELGIPIVVFFTFRHWFGKSQDLTHQLMWYMTKLIIAGSVFIALVTLLLTLKTRFE